MREMFVRSSGEQESRLLEEGQPGGITEASSIRDALPWGGIGLREDFNEISPVVISGGHFKTHVVDHAEKVHIPSPFDEDEDVPGDTE